MFKKILLPLPPSQVRRSQAEAGYGYSHNHYRPH